MSQDFDPKKIIDFNKDYYSILGLEKNNLPKPTSRKNKIEISKLIEECFRKKARKCHPDFGGSNDMFLDLIRARRILEDQYLRKVYDQGYFDEFNLNQTENIFQVDWSKIGTYRKGSPEDTVGFTLFLKICELKNLLNITPAFFPQSEEHNYEWDWAIDQKHKLVLSLVNDENEVLRLTNSDQIENALPFKIYLCIPNSNLSLKRKNNSVLDPFGKTLINAQIEVANYNDYNLLETTDLEFAKKYIENNLIDDLNNFKNGDLKSLNKTETKWLNHEEIKKVDMAKLSAVLNMKSFEIVNDEDADKFLDDLEDDENL